jgi:hypothetical protein
MVQVATSGLLSDNVHHNKGSQHQQSHRRIRHRPASQRPRRSIKGLWCFVAVAIAGNVAVLGWILRHAFHTKSTSTPTSSLSQQQQQHAATMVTSLRSPVAATATAATIITSENEPLPVLIVQDDPVSLLQDLSAIVITTDVRGNLGPAPVMLQNGTDWIKDRWQAASDMHGTAVKGSHWVRLDFPASVSINSLVLDWEAAYANDYKVQILPLPEDTMDNNSSSSGDWHTIYDGEDPKQTSTLLQVQELGQSPGVNTKTPLHVVHTIGPLLLVPSPTATWTRSVRIWIRRSVTGWGVSLWQIQLYGHYQQQQ